MQEQIHTHPHLAAPIEELYTLLIIKLRLQQIIQGHLGARAGDGNRTVTALEDKHADFVAGDGEVDVLPLPLLVPVPRHQDAAVGEFLRRVFEGAEFGDAAGALEFTLVIPLFGEGHEEAFLALFVLQRHHGLFDVIVVGFELALEVRGLVVQSRQCESYALEFALALDAAAVLGADVDGDVVEEVLVVVAAAEAAEPFKLDDVFEGGAFEFGVGHGGYVDDGGGFRVGASPAGGGRELVVDKGGPSVFVFHGDRLDHDFHEIGARLDADYVQNAAFGFHEERLGFCVRICKTWSGLT